jgi:gluconate 5-dehydrogenase
LELDVRREASVEACVEEVYRRLGGLEMLVKMNVETMTRRGFAPYGPAGAGVEALSRVMAGDLAGSPVTVNLLLPGGATATAMIPETATPQTRARLLDPAIMRRPIIWLASEEAAGVHDQRLVAKDFEAWLTQSTPSGWTSDGIS